jgi:hypothetical protein
LSTFLIDRLAKKLFNCYDYVEIKLWVIKYVKNDKESKAKSSATKILILICVGIFIIFTVAKYTTDEDFRHDIDTNWLKKQVSESKLNTIEINSDYNPSVYAYDKYITVLSKNKLTEYTSDGKAFAELDVNISVPLVATSEKYMVMAEKEGQKIYLISGSNILWQNTVEGKISQVNVNRNGYVSIVIKNTTHKSVVVYFDLSGKELFRVYLSSTYVTSTAISTNNSYLAIGEVDYSGTIIKSYVKIVSVELAQTDPKQSIVYTYESENNEIITGIDYKDKTSAICMFNSYIQKVTPNSNERVYDITNNDLFVDINLRDAIAIIDKQSSGLFSYEYEVAMKSTNSTSENLYILNSDLPKSLLVSGNVMAINLGNEVQIINSNGWLLKNYTSSKQISNIVLGNSIAGIVYKNKIEIISL